MDAGAWADALNAAGLAGVRFAAADRTPDSSKFAGQVCHGVLIELVDRQVVRPMELGVTMLTAARAIAAKRVQFTATAFDGLAGTDKVRAAIEAGTAVDEMVAAWQSELDRFKARRERHLLY
jgi:uncharacterized protein YbbC (DUF1343 family)